MNERTIYQNDLILQHPRKGFSMQDHDLNLMMALDDLIASHAKVDNEGYCLCLSDPKLCAEDLNNLVALYLETEGRDVSECFTDPMVDMENDDVTCALLSVLKNPTTDNQLHLTSMIMKQSFNCHKKQLQKMIDERCLFITEQEMDNHGFTANFENNEFIGWRRYA